MSGPEPAPSRIDIRAYACPMTWVKTRIALERLAEGERLEVWLRAGEPLESVPRSAEEDGHRVLAVEPLPGAGDGAFRLVLEKRRPADAPVLP
ncbi:SirA family protein [Anaeromyxobacter dehalogenans 2CP-1]|uniref:SirA family protein n=1 Tax=Anaeromyxobacter dehalogenans (strain ATCC BAA-258 / DSM 21875 / 2CP-1) TaxID=455488 RepID=B8JBC7_ANAD2|nr:sulfurtransferase TusA family protein [Anaeromyxobacter dehalogenans]ACL65754.1 SirA family protein [Anaeromyxobacter dehalogenans 2CP-1]